MWAVVYDSRLSRPALEPADRERMMSAWFIARPAPSKGLRRRRAPDEAVPHPCYDDVSDFAACCAAPERNEPRLTRIFSSPA